MYQIPLDLVILGIDDHTVWNSADKILDMPGPHPDSDGVFPVGKLLHNLTQPFSSGFLDPFHT